MHSFYTMSPIEFETNKWSYTLSYALAIKYGMAMVCCGPKHSFQKINKFWLTIK